MLKWARQTKDIDIEHKKKIKESAAWAKEEAEQEIKAIEKEIHKKNEELNNDAVGQWYQIGKIKNENDKLVKNNKIYKWDMMLNAETVEEYNKRQ